MKAIKLLKSRLTVKFGAVFLFVLTFGLVFTMSPNVQADSESLSSSEVGSSVSADSSSLLGTNFQIMETVRYQKGNVPGKKMADTSTQTTNSNEVILPIIRNFDGYAIQANQSIVRVSAGGVNKNVTLSSLLMGKQPNSDNIRDAVLSIINDNSSNSDETIDISLIYDPTVTVTIKYVDGNGSDISPNTTLNGFLGDAYKQSVPTINGFKSSSNVISGVFGKSQTITINYFRNSNDDNSVTSSSLDSQDSDSASTSTSQIISNASNSIDSESGVSDSNSSGNESSTSCATQNQQQSSVDTSNSDTSNVQVSDAKSNTTKSDDEVSSLKSGSTSFSFSSSMSSDTVDETSNLGSSSSDTTIQVATTENTQTPRQLSEKNKQVESVVAQNKKIKKVLRGDSNKKNLGREVLQNLPKVSKENVVMASTDGVGIAALWIFIRKMRGK